MTSKPPAHRLLAFLYGAPIGALGGLMGLGGAEFRLPVLKAVFNCSTRRAVALNLAVRLGAFEERSDLGTLVLPMGVGSILGAFLGGILVPYVPAGALKVGLGVILIVSAIRIFRARSQR